MRATGMVKLERQRYRLDQRPAHLLRFQVQRLRAAFTIDYRPDDLFHLKGVGLVE
jgi:hypothetical protein